jgi:hypothetical protein
MVRSAHRGSLDRLQYPRVSVAEHQGTAPQDEIEDPAPVRVEEMRSLGPLDHELKAFGQDGGIQGPARYHGQCPLHQIVVPRGPGGWRRGRENFGRLALEAHGEVWEQEGADVKSCCCTGQPQAMTC